MLGGNGSATLEVQVVQIPQGDDQKPLQKVPHADDRLGASLAAHRETAKRAAPLKIEGVQTMGGVAAGGTVSETVHVDMTSKRAPGTAVFVTKLYDLGAEENSAEFEVHYLSTQLIHGR
jgi:hypothetical protein